MVFLLRYRLKILFSILFDILHHARQTVVLSYLLSAAAESNVRQRGNLPASAALP